MSLSRFNVALYVALIFASGVLVGVFGHRLYTVNTVIAKTPKTPEDWRRQFMSDMQTRVHIRAAQASQINTILDDTRTRIHEVHERYRPEMESIKHEQQGKIRAVLDDGQRAEYDKMRAERERNAPKNGPGI